MPVAYTSRLSLADLANDLPEKRRAVYDAIRRWPHEPGPSIADLAKVTGMKECAICGRVNELRRDGLIEDAPLKRSPETGKTVKTYRALAYRPQPPLEMAFDKSGQGTLFSPPA